MHCTCTTDRKAEEILWKFNDHMYKGKHKLSVQHARPRPVERESTAHLQPTFRATYVPPLQTVTQRPPADSSSSDSDSESDSDSKPGPSRAPAAAKRPLAAVQKAEGEPAKKKVKIIKVIKVVRKGGKAAAEAAPAPAPAAAEPPAPATPATEPPAKVAKKVVKRVVKPEAPAAPPPAPPAPEAPPAPAAPAAPAKKIVKKVIKKVVKPKAATDSNAPAAPEAGGPAGATSAGAPPDVSPGVAKAWAAFITQVEGQGFTAEMITGCSAAEFDDIVQDMGLSGIQKVAVKKCYAKLTGKDDE